MAVHAAMMQVPASIVLHMEMLTACHCNLCIRYRHTRHSLVCERQTLELTEQLRNRYLSLHRSRHREDPTIRMRWGFHLLPKRQSSCQSLSYQSLLISILQKPNDQRTRLGLCHHQQRSLKSSCTQSSHVMEYQSSRQNYCLLALI